MGPPAIGFYGRTTFYRPLRLPTGGVSSTTLVVLRVSLAPGDRRHRDEYRQEPHLDHDRHRDRRHLVGNRHGTSSHPACEVPGGKPGNHVYSAALSSTPGLSSPFGSRACLIRRIATISAPDRDSPSHRALARPTPCSELMLPRWPATRFSTASVSSAPRSPASRTLTCRLPSLR